MTTQEFWEKIQENLELPFETEEIESIDSDPLGNIYIDLTNGLSYSLSFQEAVNWNDDSDEEDQIL